MSTVTIAVEYVWCSGANTHHDLRSKVKSMPVSAEAAKGFAAAPATLAAALSVWNFDGSSTGQAKGKDTEILLFPKSSFAHPFMAAGISFVALCECHLPRNAGPTPDNTRAIAGEVFAAGAAQKPWFGLEQEYVLYKGGRPLGWPEDDSEEPAPQGQYYCGSGALSAIGRKHAVKHYETCIAMGLKLSGINAEVMPAQWEFQVGPCEGIEAGDHVLLARWVFLRQLEGEGIDVNFDAKPKQGDWNGSGMHCNFSTAPMRVNGGMQHIEAAIAKLGSTYMTDVAVYGSDNIERLTGKHETSRLDVFNCDVGTRTTSCRIPNAVKEDGHGYFEDRRPSSSADPYLVTARLFASSCGVPSARLEARTLELTPDWLKEMMAKQAAAAQ
jgi:glutamine synthetase